VPSNKNQWQTLNALLKKTKWRIKGREQNMLYQCSEKVNIIQLFLKIGRANEKNFALAINLVVIE
jgi:hypothetical protein